MWTTLVLLSTATLGRIDPPADKAEFARQVRAAYEQLDSLYFEAVVTGYEWAAIDPDGYARGRVRELFKVWMADGPRFRVEGFLDGKLVCAVVSDGQEVTDWFPAENRYTRYPLPDFNEEYELKCRLFANRELRAFCDSWVDGRGPFGVNLERDLAGAGTRRAKPRRVGDADCEVFVKRESYSNAGQLHFVKWNETLYFNRETLLLMRRKQTMTVVSLAMSYGSLTTTFRDVRPNVELPPDIFVFKPPAGAEFIPPDDPRFRHKADVNLIGRPAPGFALPSTNGETISLADFKGKKVVLLVFWATWCPPCRQEIPTLIKLHQEFGDRGLTIIGVCSNDKNSVEDVRAFLRKRPLPYINLHDEKQEATADYGAKAVPSTILIDKSGTVVKTWRGWGGEEEEREIRTELAKLGLGPPAASRPAADAGE